VRCPDGCTGGFRSDGCGNAVAERGDARGVDLGVRGQRCNEGDGEEGGRRRIQLNIYSFGICYIYKNMTSDSKKIPKQIVVRV